MGRKGIRENFFDTDLPEFAPRKSSLKSSRFFLQYRRSFFSRPIFIAILSQLKIRNRRIRVLSRNEIKISRPKPVISPEIISLATGSRAKQKSHHPLGVLAMLEEQRKHEMRKKRRKEEEERTSDRLAWAILGCDSRYRACSNPMRAKTHYAPLRVLFALLSSAARYSSQAGANQQVTREAALRAAGGLTLAFFAAIRVA